MTSLTILDLPLYWEMVNAEKIALFNILKEANPSIAIEIGTKNGGSLQLLSALSEKVYSLDINPAVTDLSSQFSNVQFIIGDSKETLPNLLRDLVVKGEHPAFILVDGDHSREGVRYDLESILNLKVTEPLTVLMHDSFNPDCRQGMLDIDYKSNPYVEMVDLDFVQGIYSPSERTRGEMWGGFGLISLKPLPERKSPLVRQSNAHSYQRTYQVSKHYHYKAGSVPTRIKSYLFRKLFI
ncbi:MAG: class I SAM-dependent methyltransferase [Flavobacterium sp.]|nr:MAG: class I SAM-dependent methyltransferase [Flavobacterium sp.]